MKVLTRQRRRRGTALLAAAMALGLGVVTAAPSSAATVVFDQGHLDVFDVAYGAGELHLHMAESITNPPNHTEQDPAGVLLRIKPTESAITVPSPPGSFSFLGSGGETRYLLPQTQNAALLWPGIATEEVPGGVFTNPLRIEVVSVTGPGPVSLWQTGFSGPTSVLSGGGFNLPGTILQNAGAHAHYNWAFHELGEYTMQVRASGDLVGGGTLTSETQTYTWLVGEAPPPPPASTLSISGLAAEYAVGDTANLTAVQDPAGVHTSHRWFTRPYGTTTWNIVDGVGGDAYSFTISSVHHNLEIIARLYDGSNNQVAESLPVRILVAGGGATGPADQLIRATLPANIGALVVSVDPADREVTMSDFALSSGADRWEAGGDLRPVTVTDTRSGAPGWVASGQVGAFVAGTGSLPASSLGWTPRVLTSPSGTTLTPGDVVVPGYPSGDGLSVSRTLATAAAGTGTGTSTLDAGLLMYAPTNLTPGTYEGTITFTAI